MIHRQKKKIGSTSVAAAAIALALVGVLVMSSPVLAADAGTAELERRIEELTRELEQAKQELDAAKKGADTAVMQPTEVEPYTDAEPALVVADEPPSDEIKIGPVTIGGAMRVNYIRGSYTGGGDGPNRGGHGGNFELDTFRINMGLDYEQVIGKLEYRWYNGYNFLHTGWLGYQFDDDNQIQVGVTRVPFGPGPYGVSQSWFFDQHYYVGLSDDMDLGVKYVTTRGNWDLDLAWFYSSEGNGNGTSEDSARYGYDAVKWTSALDDDGNLLSAAATGFEERNQFNLRAIYNFDDWAAPTDLGVSLQYGQLKGKRADNGHHWAVSAHMVNQFGNFKLASQLTRYEYDIDDDNPWGTDTLVPMGAYDFAWPVAAKAWIPAVSLSYRYDTPQLGWLDYVLPYVEYSNIVKDDGDFNNSQMLTLGAAWANGGWYIYSDLVYSNGNYFVGNDGDNYANIYNGVGDFGVTGNDKWNYRFNLNFGYYF